MVKIIVGLMGSSVSSGSAQMSTEQHLQSFLSMLKTHRVHELDTARVYGGGKSEELLGQILNDNQEFAIATKAPGFFPGALAYQSVIDNCNASLKALQTDKIDLYYFHGPDRQTPLEESCRAINTLHREGKFSRFGISNFRADEVEEIHSLCQKNNWILPTVYQGGFNPLARAGETSLFPVLKKLNMAFYAFSPLAGGYFSRPSEQLRQPPEGGRMDQMQHFKSMYVNDVSLDLHEELEKLCAEHNVTMKEATLRWLLHHSILGSEDGVILGGSSEAQMEQNLVACESGPLPDDIVDAFEGLWSKFTADGHEVPYSV